MALALRHAAPLKPEIALAQAISEFENSLTSEHKSSFRSLRSLALSSPPSAEDVMRFTASINNQIQRSTATHRCFGTRFTNIMQCVQKYAALGDVVVGGSQNIIACGVWALVRVTIQVCIGFGSYLDKASEFFMTVGQSAPRYESMALVYRRSKLLGQYMSNYLLVIVQACHEFMRFSRKSLLVQLASSLDDSKLRDAESHSKSLGAKIREEVSFLTTQTIENEASENNEFRALVGNAYSWEKKQRKARQRARILESLSSCDHETPFRQARKCGVSTIFQDEPAYLSWEHSSKPASLILVGKLGSGKSVAMANMVDILYLSTQKRVITLFFCRHDNTSTLTARAVIGSLGRQLIDKYFDDSLLDDVVDGITTTFSLRDVLRLVKVTVPRNAQVSFVLDGVDECPEYESIEIMKALAELQLSFNLSVCISIRIGTQDHSSILQPLCNVQTMVMPKKNPDMKSFIEKELERRIEARQLVLGQEGLAVEIRDALIQGANGMFLWVALQIDSLCDEKSDAAIRNALQHLPPDLFSTFGRILKRFKKLARTYQAHILKIIIAAYRPLSVDEIREAISVEPGATDWNPDMLVNDIYGVLGCCGSLVTVDQEDLSVYLIHQSVMQFLLGKAPENSGSPHPEWHFTMEEAQQLLGERVMTYLNFSIFETQISTDIAHSIRVGELPSRVMQETLTPVGIAGRLAIRLLKSESTIEFDAKKALTEARQRQRGRFPTGLFYFFSYASKYWLQHSSWITQESSVFQLWTQLLENPKFKALTWDQSLAFRDDFILGAEARTLWRFSQRMMWAIINGHLPLFHYEMKGKDWWRAFGTVIPYLRRCMQCSPRPRISADMCTHLLSLALIFKDSDVLHWLVSMGASLPFDSTTSFHENTTDVDYALIKTKLAHDTTFFSRTQVWQLLDLALLKRDPNMARLLCYVPGLPLNHVLSFDAADPLVLLITYHLLQGLPRFYTCNVSQLCVDLRLIHRTTRIEFFNMPRAILQAAERSLPESKLNLLIESAMGRCCLLSDLPLVETIRPWLWLTGRIKIEKFSSFIQHALHDRSVERSEIASILWACFRGIQVRNSYHLKDIEACARQTLIRCLQLRDWSLAQLILSPEYCCISVKLLKGHLRQYVVGGNLLHYCADAADWEGINFLASVGMMPLSNSMVHSSRQYEYRTPLEIALRDDFQNTLSFRDTAQTILGFLATQSYGWLEMHPQQFEAFETIEGYKGFEPFQSFVVFLNRLRDLQEFDLEVTEMTARIIEAFLRLHEYRGHNYTVQLLLWCILQSFSGLVIEPNLGIQGLPFPTEIGKKLDHYSKLIDVALSFRIRNEARIRLPSQIIATISILDRRLPENLLAQGCEFFDG